MPRKTSALQIRVEEDLHQEFLDVCRSEDRPAAQILREFMREFVTKHRLQRQENLFDEGRQSA